MSDELAENLRQLLALLRDEHGEWSEDAPFAGTCAICEACSHAARNLSSYDARRRSETANYSTKNRQSGHDDKLDRKV